MDEYGVDGDVIIIYPKPNSLYLRGRQKASALGLQFIRGLKRWDEGRWVIGSLVYTLLYWGLFRIPHLPSSHLLSRLSLVRAKYVQPYGNLYLVPVSYYVLR